MSVAIAFTTGFIIVGDGAMRFRLEDLSYNVSSTDGNSLGLIGNFAGTSYSNTRVGISYGADMVKGGGDDTIINSGASTQLVDEFVYVGVGSAVDASGFPGPSNQERLDQLLAQSRSSQPFNITSSYSLVDPTGTTILAMATTTISVVPEPGAMAMLFAVHRGVDGETEAIERTRHSMKSLSRNEPPG